MNKGDSMEIIVLGAGSDLGVHIDGAKLGPGQLLNDIKSFYNGETLLLQQGDDIIKSRHLGDRRKNEYEIDKFNSNMYKTLSEYYEKDYFPIVLGGDHTVAIPSALASIKHHDSIGMIWIDAHTDYNTFETTITGNLHGLPCAAITGYKNKDMTTYHDGKTIQPAKTVIVGARSIDPKEKENLKYAGVTVFSTEDLKVKGVEAVMEEAFEIATFKTNGVHISYDLDVIDPEIAPGVSVPEFDGINEEEALKINECILKRMKDVVSYDLVEFNPLRDIDRKTEQIALNLLAQVIPYARNKDKYDNKKPLY